jgi:hypothetical protein
MLRLSNEDDLREDLELAVMEMQDRGVASSSIRRYVNSALKATERSGDGYRSTAFLRRRWARQEDPAAGLEVVS